MPDWSFGVVERFLVGIGALCVSGVDVVFKQIGSDDRTFLYSNDPYNTEQLKKTSAHLSIWSRAGIARMH